MRVESLAPFAHQDFHHLNSSQAMCFNLFFPLFNDDQRGIPRLTTALGFSDGAIENVAFEFVPDSIESTNFDFFIRFRSQRRVYFELKLSERSFGSAQNDRNHNLKFEGIYEKKVADRFPARILQRRPISEELPGDAEHMAHRLQHA
jgi:hypothetical protein